MTVVEHRSCRDAFAFWEAYLHAAQTKPHLRDVPVPVAAIRATCLGAGP